MGWLGITPKAEAPRSIWVKTPCSGAGCPVYIKFDLGPKGENTIVDEERLNEFTLTPDEARALAEELISKADEAEI